jgi:hypothetical protein
VNRQPAIRIPINRATDVPFTNPKEELHESAFHVEAHQRRAAAEHAVGSVRAGGDSSAGRAGSSACRYRGA